MTSTKKLEEQHGIFAMTVDERLLHMQENVLAEAAMMIPETRQRLEAAFNDLQSYLVRMPHPCMHAACDSLHSIKICNTSPACSQLGDSSTFDL